MTVRVRLLLLLAVLLSRQWMIDAGKHNHNKDKYDYGSVIDAGSTHSQLNVYQWINRKSKDSTSPQTKPVQIGSSLSLGPISSLTTQSETNLLLTNLTAYAKQLLADEEDMWPVYPIYLKATAGMRILPTKQRENILNMIQNYFQSEANPFLYDATQAIIASGEEESIFDWLSVNFLVETLNGAASQTYGALDMGGQSTQIAFVGAPPYDILADFTAVRLWEQTFRVYTHSFLTYGSIGLDTRLALLVYQNSQLQNSSSPIVYNPCLAQGYNKTYTLEIGNNGTFVNSSQVGNSNANPYACKQLCNKLLFNKTECFTKSCSINGVYQPNIPPDMTFVAFSAFAYWIDGCHLNADASISTIYQLSIQLCKKTYAELLDSSCNVDNKNAEYVWNYCQLGMFFTVLLHKGYGFPFADSHIIFTNSLGTAANLDWTQGSILRDSNWLSFDIEYNKKHGLNNEGKAYQFTTFGLCGFVAFLIGVILFCWCKNRNTKKSNDTVYSSMNSDIISYH